MESVLQRFFGEKKTEKATIKYIEAKQIKY